MYLSAIFSGDDGAGCTSNSSVILSAGWSVMQDAEACGLCSSGKCGSSSLAFGCIHFVFPWWRIFDPGEQDRLLQGHYCTHQEDEYNAARRNMDNSPEYNVTHYEPPQAASSSGGQGVVGIARTVARPAVVTRDVGCGWFTP